MINAIPIVAENRIRDAMERGEFDYLDGAGKPFADMDGGYDPNWWIKRKLQREQLTPEDARIVLEKLGQGGPAMTKEEFYDQGMGAFAMAEYDSAIEYYRKAVEADPGYFDAWHALGMAYLRAGKIQEAIQAGKRSVEINPNDMLAHTSLSMYYMKAGDKAMAEAEKGKATVLSWGGHVDNLDKPETP